MAFEDAHVQAVDFLDKLLRYDHQDRLTAREAMVGLLWAFGWHDGVWKLVEFLGFDAVL